ncbi:MAG: hypothetical protein JNL74_23725, partial [Fibrobacteres bacterium]|nr:hypothetical protein [Fibrobacterota bacterium]
MKKILVAALLACLAVTAFAAPSKYAIKKRSTGMTLNIDGAPTEWNESYFIDSLHSEDNVYAKSSCLPEWNPKWYQMKLYLAHDDEWIYGACVVTRDTVNIIRKGGWVGSGDNMKLNLGGQAQNHYIPNDGSVPIGSAAGPFQPYVNMFAICRTYGNIQDSLPTYEWKLKKDFIFTYEGQTEFKFSFGSEEINKVCDNESGYFLAIGAEYIGNKQDWRANPWDQTAYYPTFTLVDTPRIATEKSIKVVTIASISANPNPFLPATSITYTVQNEGVVKIFNTAGKLIR